MEDDIDQIIVTLRNHHEVMKEMIEKIKQLEDKNQKLEAVTGYLQRSNQELRKITKIRTIH